MREEMILDLKVQVAKLTTSLKYWKRKCESMASGVGSATWEEKETIRIYEMLPDVLARNFITSHDSEIMVVALDMYRRTLKLRLENP